MSIWSTLTSALERLAGAISDLLSSRETAFSTGVVALSAKMAVADGVVSRIEIDAFRRVFEVLPGDEARVMSLFAMAQRDVAGAEAYALRLQRLYADEPETLRDVLEALYFVAASDGVIHPGEAMFLAEIGPALGVAEVDVARIEARHIKGAGDPWRLLGLPSSATEEDVRQRRRALAAEHHPDRALQRGLPAEAAALEAERLARINAAADAILKRIKST
jgi:DnaJ like chaperone protein